jgi:hypothetical protein
VVTEAVPELTGYAYVAPTIKVPAVIAYPPDRFSYGDTFDGDGAVLYTIRLYVAREQTGGDTRKLNAYISRSGAQSVIEALREHPRLQGAVDDVTVVEATNYGNWPIGQTVYLGCEIRLQAMMG